MKRLNYENIVEEFKKLSGLGDDAHPELLTPVLHNTFILEREIDESRCTKDDYRSLEYAAAVCAYYEYIMGEKARYIMAQRQLGIFPETEKYDTQMDYLKKLRLQVLAEVAHLLTDGSFLFMLVG